MSNDFISHFRTMNGRSSSRGQQGLPPMKGGSGGHIEIPTLRIQAGTPLPPSSRTTPIPQQALLSQSQPGKDIVNSNGIQLPQLVSRSSSSNGLINNNNNIIKSASSINNNNTINNVISSSNNALSSAPQFSSSGLPLRAPNPLISNLATGRFTRPLKHGTYWLLAISIIV